MTSVTDELYGFQRQAVEFAASRPGAALLCEQGTGKTHILAGLIEHLLSVHARVDALVIVPLANVETTWVRMIRRLNVALCRTWAEMKATSGSRVLLTHYEAVRGKTLKPLLKHPWTLVAYDESQRLKARASKASRAAARFKSVAHRVILSGTPIEQCPQDLWAQLRFCTPEVLGTTWSSFDAAWLKPCGFMGYDREFLWNKLSEFLERVRPVIFRVLKSEVLDLPPVTFVVETVPLLGDQARVYRELDDEQTSVLVDGRRIVCDMAITERIRLQQVAGGFIRDSAGHSVAVGRAKERRLVHVLRRYSERPVVIFCKFKEEVEICLRVAGREMTRVGEITGETRKTRSDTVDTFQRGDLDAVVCQVRAGGVGINLHRSCLVVFYSAPDSSIDFYQAVCRVDRNGQTRPVTVVLIQAQNTVDMDIHKDLLMKLKVSSRVLDDHRRNPMAKPEPKKPTPAQTKPAAPKPNPVASTKAATGDASKPEGEKKKPTPPPQPPKPPFGVPELAKVLGVKAASVRVKLRSAGIKKSSKLYGWDTEQDMLAVVGQLKKADAEKPAKAEDVGDKEDEGDDDAEDEGDDGE